MACHSGALARSTWQSVTRHGCALPNVGPARLMRALAAAAALVCSWCALATPPAPVPLGDLSPGSSEPVVSALQTAGTASFSIPPAGKRTGIPISMERFGEAMARKPGPLPWRNSLGYHSLSGRRWPCDQARPSYQAPGDVIYYGWQIVELMGRPGTVECSGMEYDLANLDHFLCEFQHPHQYKTPDDVQRYARIPERLLNRCPGRFPGAVAARSVEQRGIQVWRSPLKQGTSIYATGQCRQVVFVADVADTLTVLRADPGKTQTAIPLKTLGPTRTIPGASDFQRAALLRHWRRCVQLFHV